MSTVEKAYVRQGYELPEGYTWDVVHDIRKKQNISEDMVPLGESANCAVWGVPFKNGQPMKKI